MDTKSRLRAPKFTPSDNLLLCDIVSKYKHIIENKKTDGVNLLQKQKAWLEVMKEFHSSITGCCRTSDSLQQNYKNLKKKAKKSASDEKMDIPVDRATLVQNIEQYGTSFQSCDWEKFARNTGASEETCKEMFTTLTEEATKRDRILKRTIMGTGGGPPSNVDKDPVLEKVKGLVGPVLDGFFTIYDGDSTLMSSQNKPPIELQNIGSGSIVHPPEIPDMPENQYRVENQDNETYFSNNRANLKRRTHHLLTPKRKSETEPKQTVSDKFKLLASEKMELLELQKELIKTQLQEEKEKVEHNHMLRSMEMEDATEKFQHNKKLREMEMEETTRRYKFNEKMRQF